MRLLLDTHTFIWLDTEPERLSSTALAACQDSANELVFSVASAWEMQIKQQLGRLDLTVSIRDMVEAQERDIPLARGFSVFRAGASRPRARHGDES